MFPTTQPRSRLVGLCANVLLLATAIVAQDECASALPVVDGANGSFTNVGATTSTPAWPCGLGQRDLWFFYTATVTGATTVSTCCADYDTVLEAFDGSCGALISLACNDDACGLQSRITFATVAGNTYFLRVGGFAGATGNFVLEINYVQTGSIVLSSAGACGALSLSVTGNPNLGGQIVSTMSGVPIFAIPFIGYDLVPWGGAQPCLPCFIGHNWTYPFAGASHILAIPCDPALIGLVIYVQGVAFGPGTTGCPFPPFDLTDTYAVTIG
ncbi:MAG: hypothetical protein IPK26_29145 [Planctomycetes bacterium]|nr:hypothetical protein [Planctomycetota bacterium]